MLQEYFYYLYASAVDQLLRRVDHQRLSVKVERHMNSQTLRSHLLLLTVYMDPLSFITGIIAD